MRRARPLRVVGRALLAALAAAFGCAAYIYLTLPDVRTLRTQDPATTAFMELREREALARGEKPRRVHRWVRYSRISPHLSRAVLVAEDSAFWQHDGVDYQQLRESVEVNLERMEFYRGASTITQQLAKNLYLSPSKNPLRKGSELLIARRLEAELSKRRILEIYLNVVEWGAGIWGAEAAARTYFRKPASDLTASEAALLAASLTSPRVFDPAHPSPRLRRRQQMVLRRMGAVTPPADAAPPQEPAGVPADGAPASLPGEVLPLPPPGGHTPPGGPGRLQFR
jgi:monofunctional biosynthetic peptidoglycan transglycosylase